MSLSAAATGNAANMNYRRGFTEKWSEEKAIQKLSRAKKLPFQWWHPWTWPAEWRNLQLAQGGFWILNYWTQAWARRPWYAGMSRTLAINGIMTASVYWLAKTYEDQAKLHSAMIEHYIELHPEDFKVFNKENQRTFGELLFAWIPKRPQHRSQLGDPRTRLDPTTDKPAAT